MGVVAFACIVVFAYMDIGCDCSLIALLVGATYNATYLMLYGGLTYISYKFINILIFIIY
jgi:hypothetical protein